MIDVTSSIFASPPASSSSVAPAVCPSAASAFIADALLDALCRDWQQLSVLLRARRLRHLAQAGGYSKRGLAAMFRARKLKVSEKQVRDLLLIAELPPQDLEAYAGNFIGRKKLLKHARQYQNQQRRMRAALAQGNREQLVQRLARLIEKFIKAQLPAKWLWEDFFGELGRGSHWTGEFANLRPSVNQMLNLNAAPQAIAATQPQALPGDDCDILNRLISWTAAWTRRVMPDPEIIDDAIDQARRRMVPRM